MRPGENPTETFEVDGEDSGNGSLMRLAPVPIFFAHDPDGCRATAIASSLTTHPGPIAAEACALMAHVIRRAITWPQPAGSFEARAFLDQMAAEYLALLAGRATARLAQPPAQRSAGLDEEGYGPGEREVRKMLQSAEPEASTERNWNWKSESLELARTLRQRGRSYNGYPVSAG